MKWLKWALLVTLAATLSCSTQKSDKLQILVSPKGLTQNFWLKVKAGAEAAGKDLDVQVIWKGPQSELDIAGQIGMVEDYINKKVDGIVLAACDTRGLIPTIQKALTAGIPLVTIDSGVDSDLPASFIATDNILGASMAADKLAELLKEQGEVGCIPIVPGAATSIMREQGFKERLPKYPGVKLVAVQYSQSEVATAMSVTENILTANPNLAGLFAASEAGTIGCAQALISRNVTGKVKLVGFDASPDQIKLLRKGVVQALIVQNPYQMGYQGVKSAVTLIKGGKVEKRIDTGVTVVTMENVDTPQIQKLLSPVEQN
jgi:ribose transport system substrate-binding protein